MEFINTLTKVVEDMDITHEKCIILGGDFNIVRDMYIDKKGGTVNCKKLSNDKLDILMESLGLNDSWRIKNPNSARYTWRQKTPFIQCRLDYFLISSHIYDNIDEIEILPSLQSDHSIISVSFSPLENSFKGPVLWKFNNKLLLDTQFEEILS